MSNQRRKNDVLENIQAFGGSNPTEFGFSAERKYPKNYHPIIQYLYDNVFTLKEIIEKEIPNSFPITKPQYKGSKFKHSDAEMFFSVPLEILDDANTAIDLCLKLKACITAGRSILANYYPKRLEMPSYQIQNQDNQLQDDIHMLDGFFDTVNKIQDKIADKRQSSFQKTIDKKELERLQLHIIKIGYDILTTGKNLVELYPSLLTTKEVDEDPYPNFHTTENSSVHDSAIDKFVCDISDRLLENLERDEKNG